MFVAACLVVAGNLASTLLSPSISVSLWGSEPGRDGYSFYNYLFHFILFAVLTTHLKTIAQLWRLFGAIVVSGVAVGFYGILQYLGLDPFGVHAGGDRVVSSLGNPIFAAAFLLMVRPIVLTMALRFPGPRLWGAMAAWWITVMAIPLLTIAYTQARGPGVGLAAAFAGFFALALLALGWRTALRAGTLVAASIGITLVVVALVPPLFAPAPTSSGRTSQASVARRIVSIEQKIKAARGLGTALGPAQAVSTSSL